VKKDTSRIKNNQEISRFYTDIHYWHIHSHSAVLSLPMYCSALNQQRDPSVAVHRCITVTVEWLWGKFRDSGGAWPLGSRSGSVTCRDRWWQTIELWTRWRASTRCIL